LERRVNAIVMPPVQASVAPSGNAAHIAEAAGQEATNAASEARHSANT
jgi:hypothetical protein